MSSNFTYRKTDFFAVIGIVTVGLLLYFQSIGFSLLPYDDNFNIYENPYLLKGDWIYFWKNQYVNLYVPVTYTLWTWVYELFGSSSQSFHALNVTFHLLNATVIFLFLRRLKFSGTGAAAGALFFLIRPLQAEPVAWATAFKDIFSFFFVLVSLYLWVFFPRVKILAILFFYLALLSKPSAVAFPVVLAFLSFARAHGTSFTEKVKAAVAKDWVLILAFLGTIPVIIISKTVQAAEIGLDAVINLGQRVIIMMDALGFYLLKIIFPSNLAPDYGRPPSLILSEESWYLNAFVSVLFVILMIWITRKVGPKLSEERGFMYWLLLLFALTMYLPISGAVSFGYQSHSTTADRYMYPVLFSVAALVSYVTDNWLTHGKKIIKAGVIVYFVFLGAASYLQTTNWKNAASFYRLSYEGAPHVYKYVHNMAVIYQTEGDVQKSMDLFYKALELDPTKLPPVAGIVSNLFNQKRFSEMDDFGKKYLQLEKLKAATPSPESLTVIYRAYAMANLIRGLPEKALPVLCLAHEIIAKPNAEFTKLLEDTRAKVNPKNQYCPASLADAGHEVF